jgi:hypothetical protein
MVDRQRRTTAGASAWGGEHAPAMAGEKTDEALVLKAEQPSFAKK